MVVDDQQRGAAIPLDKVCTKSQVCLYVCIIVLQVGFYCFMIANALLFIRVSTTPRYQFVHSSWFVMILLF